ncbi:MAG TPA: hypothetical protein QGH10_16270 [Armatimonadota bacterium]|nr:hypothetical protein [Armatimonadota bacterium]
MPKRSAKKKLPDPNSRRANVVRKKLGIPDASSGTAEEADALKPSRPKKKSASKPGGAPKDENVHTGIRESVKAGADADAGEAGRDGVKRQMYMGRKYWDFVDVESVQRRVRLGRKVYLYEIVEEALDLLMEKTKSGE